MDALTQVEVPGARSPSKELLDPNTVLKLTMFLDAFGIDKRVWLGDYVDLIVADPTARFLFEAATVREIEVISLSLQHLTFKEIARQLPISFRMVGYHKYKLIKTVQEHLHSTGSKMHAEQAYLQLLTSVLRSPSRM